MKVTSHSEISTYLECQKKWDLQYNKGIKFDNVHFQFGSMGHKTLETRIIPDELLYPELKEVYSFNMRKENWGFIRETIESFKDNFISVFAFFAEKSIVDRLKETVYNFANHKTNFDLRIFANKIFDLINILHY